MNRWKCNPVVTLPPRPTHTESTSATEILLKILIWVFSLKQQQNLSGFTVAS